MDSSLYPAQDGTGILPDRVIGGGGVEGPPARGASSMEKLMSSQQEGRVVIDGGRRRQAQSADGSIVPWHAQGPASCQVPFRLRYFRESLLLGVAQKLPVQN